jgi:excisionase family DNA binding protein
MADRSAFARHGSAGRASQVKPGPGDNNNVLPADAVPNISHNLPEVSERLGCSLATVRRRIASGALPAFQHGRILRVLEPDLQAFIQASRKWR